MRKMNLCILTGVLLLMPTGCSKYWCQEGKTFEECERACVECFQELSKRTDFSGVGVNYEIEYMNQCMQGKGYREVSAGELPMDAKRREPDTSLNWRARGIAGSVE